MKTILSVFCLAVSLIARCQDTIRISAEKYKYIKIADKVFKIEITLKEVEGSKISSGRIFFPNSDTLYFPKLIGGSRWMTPAKAKGMTKELKYDKLL